MQHDFDLIRFDSESEQCADEDSHAVDAVHMKDLAEIARFFGERQQFFEVRVSKPDPGFPGGSHFHDLNDFGQYLSGLTHQTNAASLRMSRAAPKSQRRERREPDHLEVGVLKRDPDGFGIHSQTRSRPAVNLDAMR